MSKKFILLYGPPAVGKLTIGQKIVSQNSNYLLVHNHITFDIVATIHQPFTHEFLKLNKILKHAILDSLIEDGKRDIILTLCYAKGHDDEFVNNLISKLQEYEFAIYLVQLKAKLDELSARVGNSSRKEYDKIHDPNTLQTVMSEYEITSSINSGNGVNTLVLNTGNEIPNQSVQLILDFVANNEINR